MSTTELVKAKLLDLSNFLIHNQDTLPVATCQKIYETLPSTHKSALKRIVVTAKRKDETVTGRKCRQQKLFQVQSVEPPEELQDRIETWVEDFESFFQDPESAITANRYSISASFIRIAQNEEKRQVATIRRRFDLESIYKRVVAGGYHTGNSWRHGGSTQLAIQLQRSPTVSGDVAEIRTKLERYVELGSSWSLWAERLGGPGYFVILPQTVAEGLYERRQNRIDIDTSADEVCRLGIHDTASRLKIPELPTQDLRTPSTLGTVPLATPSALQQSAVPSIYYAISASVPDLSRPQWGSTNAMASSTAGPAFFGNAPLTGFESPDLNIPQWGSSQTMASSAAEDFSYDFHSRTGFETSDTTSMTGTALYSMDPSTSAMEY